jgi:2-dehydropantoate 2-reductase
MAAGLGGCRRTRHDAAVTTETDAMKICIFGAGAVAGLAGARMARGGVEGLSIVARGAHLHAIQENGLTVRDREGSWTVNIPATDDTAALGEQDVIVLGLKAHTVGAALDQIAPLVGPDTVIVPTVNGIPWWYFHALPGDWPKRNLDSVDPGGRIWRALGPEKALGCVVYVASNIPEPGVIEHNNGGTYIVGEPDGSRSERAERVAALFAAGGLKSPVSEDIRGEVWAKLWGNLSGNPISALCDVLCNAMAQDEGLNALTRAMMAEAHAVSKASGVDIDIDIDYRLELFERLGPVKTSMLQDFEAGKAIELDALLGVICELGRLGGVETPCCDTVYVLTRARATAAGRYTPPA